MARRKRAAGRSGRAAAPEDQSVDVADLGRQIGTFETNNGLAHGIVGTAVVVLAVLILRPVGRALKAFLRG
jgi:hypothetical protein